MHAVTHQSITFSLVCSLYTLELLHIISDIAFNILVCQKQQASS